MLLFMVPWVGLQFGTVAIPGHMPLHYDYCQKKRMTWHFDPIAGVKGMFEGKLVGSMCCTLHSF